MPPTAAVADSPEPMPMSTLEKQASLWNFIDQVLVKYGPLGVMLIVVIYYVVVKDQVIEKKDALLMDQQKAMVDMTKTQTEAISKASASQIDVARAVEDNTRTMQRLVGILEQRTK